MNDILTTIKIEAEQVKKQIEWVDKLNDGYLKNGMVNCLRSKLSTLRKMYALVQAGNVENIDIIESQLC